MKWASCDLIFLALVYTFVKLWSFYLQFIIVSGALNLCLYNGTYTNLFCVDPLWFGQHWATMMMVNLH